MPRPAADPKHPSIHQRLLTTSADSVFPSPRSSVHVLHIGLWAHMSCSIDGPGCNGGAVDHALTFSLPRVMQRMSLLCRSRSTTLCATQLATCTMDEHADYSLLEQQSLEPSGASSVQPLHAQVMAAAGPAAQAEGTQSTMPRLPTLSEWQLPFASPPDCDAQQMLYDSPSMASMHAPAQHITASTASPGPAADAQWLQSMQTSPQGASSHRGSSRSLSPELAHQPERVLIVKGHPARLATQSEQFANELSQHLGICAPACRILRKLVCDAPSHHEW